MVLLEHIPKSDSSAFVLDKLNLPVTACRILGILELKYTDPASCCFSFLLLKTYTSFVVLDIIQSLFIIVCKIYWKDVWSYI